MKPIIILSVFALLFSGCEKGSFDISNPDVAKFVRQLKNGTYSQFEWSQEGERLWALMPAFGNDDVPALLSLAADTCLVTPCDHFPVNPVSSIPPYRADDGRESIMIGEFLLWCAEAVIEGKDYASLVPVAYDENDPQRRLTGKEILSIRNTYLEWWKTNNPPANPAPLPLDGTTYSWR
jgi:hypothetical protein